MAALARSVYHQNPIFSGVIKLQKSRNTQMPIDLEGAIFNVNISNLTIDRILNWKDGDRDVKGILFKSESEAIRCSILQLLDSSMKQANKHRRQQAISFLAQNLIVTEKFSLSNANEYIALIFLYLEKYDSDEEKISPKILRTMVINLIENIKKSAMEMRDIKGVQAIKIERNENFRFFQLLDKYLTLELKTDKRLLGKSVLISDVIEAFLLYVESDDTSNNQSLASYCADRILFFCESSSFILEKTIRVLKRYLNNPKGFLHKQNFITQMFTSEVLIEQEKSNLEKLIVVDSTYGLLAEFSEDSIFTNEQWFLALSVLKMLELFPSSNKVKKCERQLKRMMAICYLAVTEDGSGLDMETRKLIMASLKDVYSKYCLILR
ncbi:hypothetical protein ACOME3_005984 [Neoechinorhynchus agilis]